MAASIRPLGRLVFYAALCGLVAAAIISLVDGIPIPATRYVKYFSDDNRKPAPVLDKTRAMGQSLVRVEDYLSFVTVMFGTYQGTSKGLVEIRLLDGSKPPTSKWNMRLRTLASTVVDAQGLPDTEGWLFDLGRVLRPRPDGFYLMIQRLSGWETGFLTVWLTNSRLWTGPKADNIDLGGTGDWRTTPGFGHLEISYGLQGMRHPSKWQAFELAHPWFSSVLVGVVILVAVLLARFGPGPLELLKKAGAVLSRLPGWSNLILALASLALIWGLAEIGTRLILDEQTAANVSIHQKRKPLNPNRDLLETVITEAGPDQLGGLYGLTEKGWRLIPNVRAKVARSVTSGREVEISTNSLGHRHPELGPKAPGEFRILVLGDSITVADYLPDKETYVRVLEDYLNERAEPGRKFTVINAGVGAIDLESQYQLLLETGLKTQPDLVLVGLYLNDANPSLAVPPSAPRTFIFAHSKFLRWLYARVMLAWQKIQRAGDKGLKSGLTEFLANHETDPEGDPEKSRAAFNHLVKKAWVDWGCAWSETTWLKISGIMDRIRDLEEQGGFQTAVGLFPVGRQVYADFVENAPQRMFKAVMTKLDLAHHDLLPVMRRAWQERPGPAAKRWGPEGYLFFDGCHPTTFGNRLVGRDLGRFLVGSGLVPAKEG